MKRKHYDQQPGPAENVQVCKICKFDPLTCKHRSASEDRKKFRAESIVWCSDWEPRDPPARPPFPKTTDIKGGEPGEPKRTGNV